MMASPTQLTSQLDSNDNKENKSLMTRAKIMEFSFPHKLWIVVNSNLYNFIGWMSEGTALSFDMNAMENYLCAPASIFKTQTICSFLAQLKKYDFVRLQDSVALPVLHFQHPNFQRNRLDLLAKVRPREVTCLPTNNIGKENGGVMSVRAPQKQQISKGDLPKIEFGMRIEHAKVKRLLALKFDADKKQRLEGAKIPSIVLPDKLLRDPASSFYFPNKYVAHDIKIEDYANNEETLNGKVQVKSEELGHESRREEIQNIAFSGEQCNPILGDGNGRGKPDFLCGMYGDRVKLEKFFGEKYKHLLDMDFSAVAQPVGPKPTEPALNRSLTKASVVQKTPVPTSARKQQKLLQPFKKKLPSSFKLSKKDRGLLSSKHEAAVREPRQTTCLRVPKSAPFGGFGAVGQGFRPIVPSAAFGAVAGKSFASNLHNPWTAMSAAAANCYAELQVLTSNKTETAPECAPDVEMAEADPNSTLGEDLESSCFEYGPLFNSTPLTIEEPISTGIEGSGGYEGGTDSGNSTTNEDTKHDSSDTDIDFNYTLGEIFSRL